MTFHSQLGQDLYLHHAYFRNKRNGVFLDVGAYDGRHLSNTCFFERERDWTGICIEPTPGIFARLATNRPNATCLNVAAADYDGEADFLEVDALDFTRMGKMLSGLVENLDAKHRRMIENNNKKTRTIRVLVRKLGGIIAEHSVTHIDYCSIDTEGSELKALSSVDFDGVTIDAITIEVHYDGAAVDAFFEERDYALVHEFADYERLYVRPSLKRLPTTTVVVAVGPQEIANPALLAQHRRSIAMQTVPVERAYYVHGVERIPPHLGGRIVFLPDAKPLPEIWQMAAAQAETPYLLPLDPCVKLTHDAVESLEAELWRGRRIVGAPLQTPKGDAAPMLFAWPATTGFVGDHSVPPPDQPSSSHWIAAMGHVARAVGDTGKSIDRPLGRTVVPGR